jgi:YidC/Oxa1 family membrane protein insertase
MGIDVTHPTAWRKGPVESYRLYMGPIDYAILKAQGRDLENIVDLGWSFVRPVSKVILAFMKFLYGIIPNYGVVILILSTLTQLLFWPLSQKSFTSMRKMQNLQPMVQALKERYKDNPQEMNRQMMALWKKEGVNPMGGCMPMVVQIPVLFALYSVLRSSIDLRGAPFVLWIDNLAAPDVLFTLPMSLPFLGNAFSLLPLLMGAAMIWRSAMSPTMPSTTPGASQQQMLMKWFMPIMMIVIFYKMPSGLVLYWLVNSLLGIWQQVLINRKFGPAAPVNAVAGPAPAKQGGNDHAAPSRGDGRQRGRSARESAGRVGGKAR